MTLWRAGLAGLLLAGLLPAQKYSGPRPEKPDLPFLLHADSLVPAEVSEAKELKKKDDISYTVEGASSKARTPLAGPIFLFQDGQLSAEKLQLFKFEVKSGRREVFSSHKGKLAARPLRLNDIGG